MAQAPRDENSIPVLMGVSSADGVTPTTIYVDPDTHRVLVSSSSIATPGGSDTQVQFNDAGTLSGDAGMTYNKTTNILTVGGALISGLTASEILGTDANKNLVSLAVATYPSLTELSYVKGVTSAIQTQLGTKAPSTAPTFATSITGTYLTASEMLITDGSKNIVSAPVATYPSLTELTYVKGVTSAIQTQLGTKAPTASPTFTGTVTMPVGLTGLLRADTGVVSVDTDVTDLVSAASDTVAGKVELATAAETTTGTDTSRAVTPDGLAGSGYGKRIIQLKIMADATTVTTGDGKLIFCIPSDLNGWNLVDADAFVTTVSSSGAPTVQIRNITQTADMLSTLITIDANEFTSYTAATAPVIDTNNDDVATGDLIAIDVDGAGTGAKGLGVILVFQLP
jgi:hypothetical protein